MCGLAAVAVYLGFQSPIGTSDSVETSISQTKTNVVPTFSVADASPTVAQSEPRQVGLKEFSTLARPSAPRVVVYEQPEVMSAPTPTQLAAIETIASLEETIRAKRARGPAPTPAYQFVSSNGLFETELVNTDSQNDEIEGIWDLEKAYLLGKYADPLTGTLPSSQSNSSINDVQHVNFSQIDAALSNQSRRSERAIDSLTVRF